MFNFNSNGNPQFMPTQPQYPQFGRGNFNQFIPSTNKRFVRSLEEALSLPADFNSQNAYFDTEKNLIYDICTNGQGEKNWAVFEVTLKQTNAKNSPENNLEQRMANIETKLEELLNGKRDVKPTDAADASTN